jgi:hypothetical protein
VNQEVFLLVRPSLTISSPTTANSASNQSQLCSQDEMPPVVGAFLPTGIDFQCKKYHGSDTMFVFTNIAEKCSNGRSGYGSTEASFDESNFEVVQNPVVYTCQSPKINEYFVRTTDGMIVFGGGGKGAAIALNDDLDTITSSFMCPTFGSSCLLPVERGNGPEACSPSGAKVEGFHSHAPIHTLEVWGISNYPLTIPDDADDA